MTAQLAASSISELLHHDLAEIFPMAGKDDMDAMIADMKANGYDPSQPIVLLDGKILDGRNRQAAAIVANVEPTFTEFEGDDPAEFVLQRNLHRRHLSASQKAMAGAKARKWYNQQAKERQKAGGGDRKSGKEIFPEPIQGAGQARDQVGKTVGVSGKTIDAATKVVEKGTPELQAAVVNGKVSASDAAKVADKPPEVQEKALEAVASGKEKTVAKAAKKLSPPKPMDEVDGWGIPIQEHAIAAFADRPKFNEVIRLLRQADKLYSELADLPGGLRLTIGGVSRNTRHKWKHIGIENAIRALEDAKPTYTVCPYAYNPDHAHDENCSLCHGLNWIPEVSKDRIPADLIKNAKGAFGV